MEDLVLPCWLRFSVSTLVRKDREGLIPQGAVGPPTPWFTTGLVERNSIHGGLEECGRCTQAKRPLLQSPQCWHQPDCQNGWLLPCLSCWLCSTTLRVGERRALQSHSWFPPGAGSYSFALWSTVVSLPLHSPIWAFIYWPGVSHVSRIAGEGT